MKRTLIALAVTAAVAAPLAAHAAPKVYGKLNLSVEQYEKDNQNPVTLDEDFSRLQSNASRFGVKGEDELTATLSAVYGIEWQVSGDGDAADLTARNRFLGIKSQNLGTVKLGWYDSYLKLAQDKTDLFNDLVGDFEYVIAGENRLKNVVAYESPKFLDSLQFNVLTQTQDANAAHKNGTSASVVFNKEDLGLYAALAFDNNIDSKTALSATRESDNLRLVLSYKIADLTLNAVYGTSKASTGPSNEETGYSLGVAYKIADETIKVQYGVAEADEATLVTQERTLLNVGIDHNFTAKTKAFAFYTIQEEDKLAANADTEYNVIGLGLEHSF